MNKEEILLSIIVPVYNVEKYLSRCLDSLLRITSITYEIILVNDGSTDNSLQICREYQERYPYINLINQSNKGLSGARNSALNFVKGTYVSYIDSDDTIEAGTLESAILYLEEHPHCNMLQFPVNLNVGHESEKFVCSGMGVRAGLNDIANSFLVSREITWRVCDKIFRFETIRDLRFIEGLVYEDNIYMAEFLLKANVVYLSDIGQYNYYWTYGSITNTYSEKNYRDMYYVHCLMYETLHSHLDSIAQKSALLYIIANDACVQDKYSSKLREDRDSFKLLRKVSLNEVLFARGLSFRKYTKLLIAKIKAHLII